MASVPIGSVHHQTEQGERTDAEGKASQLRLSWVTSLEAADYYGEEPARASPGRLASPGIRKQFTRRKDAANEQSRVFVAGLVAVALIAIGGLAVASIPGDDGVIHGCYKTKTGVLSVIDSDDTCPSGTTPLNWNQTGPQGPAGEPGEPGQPGEFSGYQQVLSAILTIASGGASAPPQTLTVTCPDGKTAIAGGYDTFDQPFDITTDVTEGSTYRVILRNAGGAGLIQLRVNCATVGT